MENFFPTRVYPLPTEADNKRHRERVKAERESLERYALQMKKQASLYIATPCSKLGNGYCICGKACFFQPSRASGT